MRKYGMEDIGFINAFEKMTNSKVMDYIRGESVLYFVVDTKNIGKLVGKNGENIISISEKFGKKIKVFKYSKDLKEFVKNLIVRPIEKIELINEKNTKSLKIKVANKDKAIIIGRDGNNLKITKELLKKQFAIENIQIE
ncbi:MAG: NusA-like transcription termination signal-binding factor [Candidatus Aenigmarchaeota archaeon]|nr:NusA-like transcription termination signal-binding factor [Candidatus Aenigmarchaeota archaeon]